MSALAAFCAGVIAGIVLTCLFVVWLGSLCDARNNHGGDGL